MIEWLSDLLSSIEGFDKKIFISIAVILTLYLIRVISLKIIFQKIVDPRDRYYWKNGVRYTTVTIGLIIITILWINEVDSVATFFGLLSAGLTIALKDPIVNLAGWLFIIIRRPFDVGDRIQLGAHAGDVIDIRIFQFTVNEIGEWVDADQSTGRIVHIPNGKVFTDSQVNFTQGFSHLWNEIGVMVTFESDWEKAKQILEKIIQKHGAKFTGEARTKLLDASKKFMIFYKTLDPIVYTSVKDSGVMLTMRYLCMPQQRRGTEHAVWEDVLKEFGRCEDIDFAYPTQRIFYNLKEGKDKARKMAP
ncbi:MAG: mechanosensitive ion channel [Cyclobacteriaceae bacterium]